MMAIQLNSTTTSSARCSFVSVAASVAHELGMIEAKTGAPVPPDGVEPATWMFAEHGRSLTATQYLANLDAMHRYARRLHAWWEHNDILITPTMSEPAPPIGELKGADVERIVRLVPYTAPYNVSGQPGIALPLHWTRDGLPIGIQLVSPLRRRRRALSGSPHRSRPRRRGSGAVQPFMPSFRHPISRPTVN